VEVRYRLSDGSLGRVSLSRIGQAVPGRDLFQLYRYTFENVTRRVTFDVVGGDDRIRGLHLEVVDRPQIVEMVLQCEHPPYLARADRTLVVTGAMQIPEGTKLTVLARANKDLREVGVHDPDQGTTATMDAASAGDGRRFELALAPLVEDRVLMFTLRDTDGIKTRQPYRLYLHAMEDGTPQVSVALTGIGTAITPDARVPVAGQITDDYGIQRVWFEYRVDEGDSRTRDFDRKPSGENRLEIDQALDGRRLDPSDRWQPNQKLRLAVNAADGYDLIGVPHVGSSQLFLLEVVTPDQLRAILERRELMLRRRFETIYEETVDTRDLIVRVQRNAPEPAREARSEDGGNPREVAGGLPTENVADPEEVQRPDDSGEAGRGRARRDLRIARAVQNVERARHETLEVARAFEEIQQELINNRVDTQQLIKRLQEGISDPLRAIGERLLPAPASRLKALEQKTTDPAIHATELRQAIAEVDTVLVEMKRVLQRMLELESYNQVLDMLRRIIEDQQQLNERTEKGRKRKLQELLEE
jgi:hypothetical protein